MSYTLHCGDNVAFLKDQETSSVQLTVTSPPYDNLRKYNGFAWDFEALAKQLWGITKPGGVVVWVVADATVDGSETGTSFKQALFFKSLGFNLHDTMIYSFDKPPLTHNRYEQKFEFMFVFSKGKPTVFNPLTEQSIHAGKIPKRTFRQTGTDLSSFHGDGKAVAEQKRKGNIWMYGSKQNVTGHPAIFPEQLAADHIASWSNPGDTVLDPFLGSGTTGKMAVLAGRNFIGCDISSEYVEMARTRIEKAVSGDLLAV